MSGLPSSLPGIDVASGLARVAGNEKLYIKLLRRVADDVPGMLEHLSSALIKGDAASAREVAHSLKGAAGNLSMIDVAEAAAKVEDAAKREDFSSMSGLLDALEKTMRDYVRVIEGLNA